MIDAESLKERIDCRDMVAAHLGKPAKKSGKVHHWLCPFHADGKTPSLAVYADGFKCFGCDEHGDVIAWVMKRDNLTFPEACERLGAGPSVPTSGTVTKRPAPTPSIGIAEPPPDDWQDQAVKVAVRCAEVLWSDAGTDWLAGLRERRGLSDDTIKMAWLGLQPADGELHGLFVPKGLVLPNWHERTNTIWGLNVRRRRGAEPRYRQVKGSKRALYNGDPLSGATEMIICEGELDCLLLQQHVGHLLDVITFGSARCQHVVSGWIAWLLRAHTILIATDNDPTGHEGWLEWHERTERARRLAPPGGCKDISDAWQAGHDLKAWALAGMKDGPD